MEIRELILKHYGKFHNHTIALKSGINIIYGGNESGKSTIHSFIRAMFFGLSRGRGKAAKTDEYQIRQPWDTPGAFLGSMKVWEQGNLYRIDRCFDRTGVSLQMTCETAAAESSDPEADLGLLLGGVSESVFVNTVFIPQAHCETDEALAQELRRYMVNSDNTMDARLDVSQVLQNLRKKKKSFEQRKKQEDEKLEELIRQKQAQAENIRSELEQLRQQAGENPAQSGGRYAGTEADGRQNSRYTGAEANGRQNSRYAGVEANGRQNSRYVGAEADGRRGSRYAEEKQPVGRYEAEERERPSGRGRLVLEILLVLAGLLALAGAFFLSEWKLKVFLGIFGAVFLLMLLPVHFLITDEEDDDVFEEEENLPETAEKDSYILQFIRSREAEYRKLQDELEQLYGTHVRPESVDTEIAALNLAIDRICELSSGIYAKSGGQLNERASGILSELTGGAYNRIRLDETGEVRIHTPSRVLGLYQVSGGTMQQIYFALRMAAGELLCQGRSLPVVLDETFAMYDDARLEAALRWLKKSGRQVILFTCQNRERQILSRIDAAG